VKRQTPKPDLQKWQKWQRSSRRIEKELRKLYFARGMFERFYSLASNSKTLKKYHNHLFFIWLENNYKVYLGMGIRRLVDKASNAQNLYKFLKDIEEHRKFIRVVNLEEYLHQKSLAQNGKKRSDCKKDALTAFRAAFGGKRKMLLSREITEDTATIEDIKKTIEKYVDDTWAHMGKGRYQSGNFKQVHGALDSLIKIYNRYSPLISGKKFEPDDNIFFNGWDTPFRTPWYE